MGWTKKIKGKVFQAHSTVKTIFLPTKLKSLILNNTFRSPNF